MHGLAASLTEIERIAGALAAEPSAARAGLALPATLISRAAPMAAGLAIGGQDCRAEAEGAYTGDLSAEMLADAGAAWVVLGHSERRAGHGETDRLVAAKVEGALRAGLEPVVCVGETLEQREAGEAVSVVEAQLRGSLPSALTDRAFCVAYEPVWAIGAGRTPTVEQIGDMHASIRSALVERFGQPGRAAPILYGGSVKPSNAQSILAVAEVDGALVGGASLKAEDFLGIVRAAG